MGHVCPWWFAYTFDNPLRPFFHDTKEILTPYVREAMRVADIGCGLGYFSLGLASIVGERGKVFAVDVQPQMLKRLARRAAKAGLSSTIHPLLCREDELDIPEPLDFALAFWMVHETPSADKFFGELYQALKPSATLLFTEPVFHVGREDFVRELTAAAKTGFTLMDEPKIRWCHAAALKRNNSPSGTT